MEEIENQNNNQCCEQKEMKVKTHQLDHVSQSIITAIIGFILSIFLIFIGLMILVRFFVFDNFLYSLFVFSFMTVGIIFNIAAVNLTLNEYPESIHILPFVVGSPITFSWTLLCIIIPFFKQNFFSQFSQLPVSTYDHGFYDPNTSETEIHPFEKLFRSENSLFENTPLFILLLIILAIAQLMFWLNTLYFYYKIKQEENKLSKIEIEEDKER